MEVLLTALALGFTAGITPGPLLTLVISTTLERGFGAGLGWRSRRRSPTGRSSRSVFSC